MGFLDSAEDFTAKLLVWGWGAAVGGLHCYGVIAGIRNLISHEELRQELKRHFRISSWLFGCIYIGAARSTLSFSLFFSFFYFTATSNFITTPLFSVPVRGLKKKPLSLSLSPRVILYIWWNKKFSTPCRTPLIHFNGQLLFKFLRVLVTKTHWKLSLFFFFFFMAALKSLIIFFLILLS